jgi:hypothetical protein
MRRLLRALLAGVLLLLIAANLARAWLAIQQAQWLAGWQYTAASGLFWALGFTICAYGLASARRWAGSAIIVAYLTYQLHLWLDRLVFVSGSEAIQRTPWLIVLSALSGPAIGLLTGLATMPSGRTARAEAR